jgi:hypothetical protein
LRLRSYQNAQLGTTNPNVFNVCHAMTSLLVRLEDNF